MERFSVASGVQAYKWLILTLFVTAPLAAMLYIATFAGEDAQFHSALVHEIAIFVAIVSAVMTTIVALLNYLRAGDPFLRFLAIGFFGFALVYLPHGLLTPWAAEHTALFLSFGPASRLVLAVYLLLAALNWSREPDSEQVRGAHATWLPHVGVLLAVATSVGVVISLIPTIRIVRAAEWVSLAVLIIAAGTAIARIRPWTRLAGLHMIAIALFIQASVAFILAVPWTHLWWLGHTVFAAGFLVITYAILLAYESRGTFSDAYDEATLRTDLARERAVQADLLRAQDELGEGVLIMEGKTVVYVNDAWTRLTGYSLEEMRALPDVVALVPPEDTARWAAERARLDRIPDLDEQSSFEATLRHRDGHDIPVEVGRRRVGKRLIAIARDISERKAAEDVLRMNSVTKPVVRRILRETMVGRGAESSKAKQLGRSVAAGVRASTLEAMIEAFAEMGLGQIQIHERDGQRVILKGDDLLEARPDERMPTCYFTLGYLECAVQRATGTPTLGSEIACQSQGAAECRFVIALKHFDGDDNL